MQDGKIIECVNVMEKQVRFRTKRILKYTSCAGYSLNPNNLVLRLVWSV